ncbi:MULTISPECIES: cupin domain-containing protein [unclassified Polaromonas]|uniref:cupin domain-containing protein n=1 Tax=unclassified Polaromonas TaxID=2638319 RepID=UPI0018C9FB28|nr:MULTISPECIES: cupin domain-containing protein [unclassified Polaromonas]MBG6072695.1 cupin 2 domain-containing protein [Polaromonas sp. CG_9.7]MBG6114586.1 cupin 2 domain-containing protein [Polaromonas sp. CG_9.2]MDH6185253.1 cupin 2 domain-containing protein [Polaromonas sp. CG_23.6]
MQTGQLLHALPASLPDEISDCLLQSSHVRIERIVSNGQHSPPGFWYDQSEAEWVLLVKGEATLRFEQGNKTLHLTPGSYVNIAAHEKHRVEWTTANEETVWLAVFY